MQLPTVSHRRQGGVIAAAAALLMAVATGCSAHGRAGEGQEDGSRAMQFVCSSGTLKSAAADVDEAAICALFKTEIERALGVTMADAPATGAEGDWVRVEIRGSSPVTVSAMVVQRINGQETSLPDMAVDVSDRPVGLSDIGMLAAQVARTIAETAGK